MSIASLPEADQKTLQKLVTSTARCFYEAKHIVVLDQLIRHPVLKDDELAGRLGLQLKDLTKVVAPLVNRRLVSRFQQNEQKENKLRAVATSYYWIDYRMFANVVKWHISAMRKSIDHKLRNELENKGYLCPQCKRVYKTIEADQLFDMYTMQMRCADCKHDVIENDTSAGVQGSSDRMERFNKQMAPITDGLKNVQAIGTLPAFDIRKHISENFFSAGNSGGSHQPELDIIIDQDRDEGDLRKQREAAAEAKRAQNALPQWHLVSTVTGQHTALGIKEHIKQQEDPANQFRPATSLPSTSGHSNARLLKDFGPLHFGGDASDLMLIVKNEDVLRPLPGSTIDDITRRYYNTPSSSLPHTPASELDVKPNWSRLNSALSGTKRTREYDVDDSPASKTLRPNSTPRHATISRHSSVTHSAASSPPGPGLSSSASSISVPDSDSPHTQPDEPIAGPHVQISGKMYALSAITAALEAQMTPEEYEVYAIALAGMV
ncbi:hypothetical protein BKA62DRAFT_281947 [Auriculariales sp. MPI-PUGE-AT-0066]|nr:hypothetical protein BKA62DRAFT_281947 [Auriculariales sp. MPI-PUGE-AT-0066]